MVWDSDSLHVMYGAHNMARQGHPPDGKREYHLITRSKETV